MVKRCAKQKGMENCFPLLSVVLEKIDLHPEVNGECLKMIMINIYMFV